MTTDLLDAATIEAHLTGRFGRPLRAHDSVGSTNEDALEWAASGAPEGAVVVTEHQTAGRGRWGRSWSSEPGRLLQFSILLRPVAPPGDAGLITTSIGVAVARAVEKETELVTKIKWPNDIVVGSRKLAGILVESRGRDRIDLAIAGIGMNVNWSRSDMPTEIAETATSVSEELRSLYPRAALLAAVLAKLENVYRWALSGRDRHRVIEEASVRSNVLGREVTIAFADGSTRSGVAERITDSGALSLSTGSGSEEIHLGEVKRLRADA